MHSILQDLVAFCQHSIRFYDFYKKAKIALDGLARSTIERDVSIPIELDIETFLDKRLIKSKATRKNYRLNIQIYFKHLDKDINTYFNNEPTNEDYENDLRTVYDIVYEQGRPLLSIRTFFNSIKQYMIANDKKLRDLEFWDILKARTKGAEPDSDEAILYQKEIKTILSHGDTLSRAMFLMLASLLNLG